MEIIDSRVRLRTQQLLKAWTIDLKPFFKDYIDWYQMKPRLTELTVKDLITYAKESNVEKMVVCGGNQEDKMHIKEVSQSYEEIIPVGGVNISNGILQAMKEVHRCCKENFAAINLAPFMVKLRSNDKKLYPIYGECELHQKPIIVHGSMHFWRGAYMWDSSPKYLDEVAVDFPELPIIISHGGNGFGPSVLAIAQRHPNVYLEFSALRPKYIAPEFIQAANTYLKRKCMFGTDYPLVEFGEAIDLWKEALRENVWQYFFKQNVLDALFNDPIPI